MSYLHLKIIEILEKMNSIQFFFLSLLICSFFYFFEGIIGIDRFYHPDSIYYLKTKNEIDIIKILSKPFSLQQMGYSYYTSLIGNNYYLLILTNFILYSLTNVLIFEKVFKKNFKKFSNIKAIFLFYLLFLEPYRLHLSSHVLKETFLIFFIIFIITTNIKILKILCLILLEILRKNSWIYLLIFINLKKFKYILDFNKKLSLIIFITLITLVIACQLILKSNLAEFFLKDFEYVINLIKKFDNKQMPLRLYDHVPNFKNYDFPIGFIIKNVTWPLFLLTGSFIFFVSSYLFKFLGLVLVLNHFIIYFISKKTYINFGLILVLILISVYTSSFTSMFRYSYIAIYASIVVFFLNLEIKKNS